MSVALVGTPQVAAWDNNSVNSPTINYDPTGGNFFWTGIGWRDPARDITMNTITFNASNMTSAPDGVKTSVGGNPGQRIQWFGIINPAAGSHALAITSSVAMGLGKGGFIVWGAASGVDTTTPWGTSTGDVSFDASGSFNSLTASVATANGDLLLDMAIIQGTLLVTSFTITGGQTIIGSTTPTSDMVTYGGSSYKAASGTPTVSSWAYAPSGTYNAFYRAIALKASTGTNLTVNPASGTLTFTGGTPTVSNGNSLTVHPAAGVITFSHGTPTVSNQTFTWYSLPAPGNYDTNSILAGQTYPAGSFIRVVTDFAHLTAVYATGPLDNDINNYATAEAGYTGSDSAVFEIKSGADGSVSQYTINLTISNSIVIGPAPATLTFTGGTPVARNGTIVTPAPGLVTFTGGNPTVTNTANLTVTPATAHITFTGGFPTVNGSGSGGGTSGSNKISAVQRTVLTALLKFLDNRRHRR